jgi:hypothetical protein
MQTTYYFDPRVTLIDTDKTVNVKDLKIGQSINDSLGVPYTLTNIEIKKIPAVKISPFRAEPYLIPLDGTLHAKSGGVSIYEYGEIVDIPYKLIENKEWISSRFKLYRTPAPFIKKNLEIHPYIIGCWFVKGNKTFIHIKCPQVVDAIKGYCTTTKGLEIKEQKFSFEGAMFNHRFNKVFYQWLQSNKLDKDIPDCPKDYLFGDQEQRIALLTGVLDSLGHLRKHCSTYDISLRRQDHAECIIWLARTLGFYSSFKITKLRTGGRIRKTEKSKGKPVIRIFITIDPNIIVCNDPKKRAPVRTCQQTNFVTGFYHEFVGDKNFIACTINETKPLSFLSMECINIASKIVE